MSAARLRVIDRVVQRGIHAGGFPGAAVVVGRKGAVVWEKGFGRIDWKSSSPHVSATETDLRSRLAHEGHRHHHRRHDPVRRRAHQAGRARREVSARIHRPAQGLASPFASCSSIARVCRQTASCGASRHPPQKRGKSCSSTPLEYKPGSCYIYSDLGAITLGVLVEKLTGQALDVFLHKCVFQPLGMINTFFVRRTRSSLASRPPKSRRRAAIRCRARCTTRTRMR